jgi:hypothetical protein
MRIDSRSIDDLRPDVAANVRVFIEMMKERGYPVGISSTYRNDEQQAYLYEQGRTRPGEIVTWSKFTTFHGARLAFDIFQNIKGKEWNDEGFWATAREILDAMGFSALSIEKPHSQWSHYGEYSGSQVRAGILPPPMPLYEEDENMTDETFAKLYEKVNPMIRTIDDVPESLKPEIQALLDSGALNGGTTAAVNPNDINMRLEEVRVAVVAARIAKQGK